MESNPKFYTYADGYAHPNWDHLPKKIHPMRKEPMVNSVRFWLRAVGVVAVFWIVAVIYGVMTT